MEWQWSPEKKKKKKKESVSKKSVKRSERSWKTRERTRLKSRQLYAVEYIIYRNNTAVDSCSEGLSFASLKMKYSILYSKPITTLR